METPTPYQVDRDDESSMILTTEKETRNAPRLRRAIHCPSVGAVFTEYLELVARFTEALIASDRFNEEDVIDKAIALADKLIKRMETR